MIKKTERRMTMRKLIFTLLTALFLLLPAAARADYTEWKDSAYPFRSVKTIYIDEMDTEGLEGLSISEEWKLKDTFYKKISKINDLTILAEEPRPEGNLISRDNTEDAVIGGKDTAIPQEAVAKGADIYIQPRITTWQVDSYLVPAHTEWRNTEVRDAWCDKDGRWHEYYRTVTYPEFVPDYWVPYAQVTVTFEWYDIKTGNLIATSEDKRVRNAENHPEDLYGRIVDRFVKNVKKAVG